MSFEMLDFTQLLIRSRVNDGCKVLTSGGHVSVAHHYAMSNQAALPNTMLPCCFSIILDICMP